MLHLRFFNINFLYQQKRAFDFFCLTNSIINYPISCRRLILDSCSSQVYWVHNLHVRHINKYRSILERFWNYSVWWIGISVIRDRERAYRAQRALINWFTIKSRFYYLRKQKSYSILIYKHLYRSLLTRLGALLHVHIYMVINTRSSSLKWLLSDEKETDIFHILIPPPLARKTKQNPKIIFERPFWCYDKINHIKQWKNL